MSVITPAVTSATVLASGAVSVGANRTGTLTLNGGYAVLSVRIQNGATGPLAPALCTVMVSHAATLPTPATAPNADWYLYQGVLAGSVVNGATVDRTLKIDGVRHVCINIGGNTSQPVTASVEATVTTGQNSV